MKRNLLELWINDRSNEDVKIVIGESLRVTLGMNPDKLTFYFKDHNKSLKVCFKYNIYRLIQRLKELKVILSIKHL